MKPVSSLVTGISESDFSSCGMSIAENPITTPTGIFIDNAAMLASICE